MSNVPTAAIVGSRPERWRLSNDEADDTDGGIFSAFLSILSDGAILHYLYRVDFGKTLDCFVIREKSQGHGILGFGSCLSTELVHNGPTNEVWRPSKEP